MIVSMEQKQFANVLIDIFQQQISMYQTHIDALKKFGSGEVTVASNSSSNNKGKSKGKNQEDSNEGATSGNGRKKKAKNPDAKPRALSAYQIFMKEQFPNFKAANPDMNPKEILSSMSKEWKSLESGIKDEYMHKSEELKEAKAEGVNSTGNSTSAVASPAKATTKISKPTAVVTAPKPTPVKPVAEKVSNNNEKSVDIFEDEDAEKKKKKKKKHHHDEEPGNSQDESRKKVRALLFSLCVTHFSFLSSIKSPTAKKNKLQTFHAYNF